MIDKRNIRRVLKRHLSYQGLIPTKELSKLVVEVVTSCVTISDLSRKEKQKELKKLNNKYY